MMQHYTTDIFVDYVNGELPADEDAAVYLHIADCLQCRDEYEIENQLREALVEYGQHSEREMPQSLVTAIFAATRPERKSPLAAFEAIFRPRITLPALGGAFSIALGVLLATGHMTDTAHIDTRMHIEAAAFFDRHSDATMTMPFADRVNSPTFESAAESGDAVDDSSTAGS